MINMTFGFKKYENICNGVECQTLITDHGELLITGYNSQIFRKLIFYLFSLPLFAVPVVLLYWYPQLIFFKYVKTCLERASHVMIKDSNSNCFVIEVSVIKLPVKDTHFKLQKLLFLDFNISNEIKYFIHKDIRYIWSQEQKKFFQLQGWDFKGKFIKDILNRTLGLTKDEENILLNIYGKNEISISAPNIWKLFIIEIARPFYLFQIFSIILWFINEYSSYAVCVGILSGWSIFTTIYASRKQRLSLLSAVQKSRGENSISVIRRGGFVEQINSTFLVPGDIIQIPQNGCVMPCDAIILKGHCIINENILTGESYPVIKIPPVNGEEMFNSVLSKRHVLFCGTQVMQTRYYGDGWVTALVISTGYTTVRGALIRSVLYPKSMSFKFYEDSVKFIFFLFAVAISGIAFFGFISFQRKVSLQTIILDSLDLITIVVPPSLPAALTTAIAYSKKRLFSKGILCISPQKINEFGKLKLMCFDKTGTLTEEGINLWGIIPCTNQDFENLIQSPSILNESHPLVVAFATCHSLIKIRGKLTGDPLDLSMFNSLEWELSEPGNDTSRFDLLCPTIVKPKYSFRSKISTNKKREICKRNSMKDVSNKLHDDNYLNSDMLPYEIGIVREFSFSSASRCMSVITRKLGSDHMNLYCKGAPEKIFDLCIPNSLPKNFSQQLQIYTSLGFRVLGVAYKKFDGKFNWRKSQRIKREEVEKDLIFLGLIILQNKLKHISTAVVNDLRTADIRCVMITGDNILTALSVSRECSLVQSTENVVEIAITSSKENDNVPILSLKTIEPVNFLGDSEIFIQPEDLIRAKLQSPENHFALDGNTWELLKTHFSHLIPYIIVKCTIFARMLPEQKTQVIEAFQSLDYITGMCGDGINDFGAMKAAHIGVSLSETESSLVAPFISKTQDVSCIVTLIKEGRCALVSTYVIFKYMVIYGLIQFISVLILHLRGVTFGNSEFLYVDLVVTSSLAVVIGRTQPAKILSKSRPIARMLSFDNLLSLALQIIILSCTQILTLQYLQNQKWFTPVIPGPEAVTVCWENSVIYCVSLFQFIILAVVYSKGKPYRLPFFKDTYFMLVLLAMTLFTSVVTIFPIHLLAEVFEIVPAKSDSRSQFYFRIKLLVFPLTNFILSLLTDALVIEKKWFKKIKNFLIKKRTSKKAYKRILRETEHMLI